MAVKGIGAVPTEALNGQYGALAKVREQKRGIGPQRNEPPDQPLPEAQVVEISDGDVRAPVVDLATGAVTIELADGSVVVDFDPRKHKDPKDQHHDDNLALEMSESELSILAEEVLQGIESDLQSRADWLAQRARGIELLGLKINPPRSTTGEGSAPLEGMSNVQHPALLEAVLRGQANANGELLPAGGPVKVRNDSIPKSAAAQANGAMARMEEAVEENADSMGEALEKDFNHYITAVATEYYPDTDRMLFMLFAGGVGIKKVYNHPLRLRPVSESVPAEDFIVSNMATDMENALRKTHRIMMEQNVMKRMKLTGVYRDDAAVTTPQFQPDLVQQKTKEVQGLAAQPMRPEDQPFTLYETLVELDVPGFEHKKRGKPTGLPLPYRITIDSQTRHVLELRRNWEAGDETYTPKKYFVKYPMIPAMGFWDLGFIHILGNTTQALTAAWREMLDGGMFANFPGFLYSNSIKRQVTSNFRIPPGGGMGLDTGGLPIGEAVMPLPYKQPATEFQAFIGTIGEQASRLGGTAELPIGEGKQDAPVGTTLALLEQATKIMSAVHKRLHAAQSEEFMLLRDRFREDPESFWRRNKKPAAQWTKEVFLKALDDYDLVPQADPNTPSHMHRLMKAVAIKQLQSANPQLYDGRAVDTHVLKIIGVEDPEALFMPLAPPPPPQPTIEEQIKMADVFIKAEKLKIDKRKLDLDAAEREVAAVTKIQEAQLNAADSEENRKSAEAVAGMRETTARMKLVADVLGMEQKGMASAEENAFAREERTKGKLFDRKAQVEDRDHGAGLQKAFRTEDRLEGEAARMTEQHEAARQDMVGRQREIEDRDYQRGIAVEDRGVEIAERDKDRQIEQKGLAIKERSAARPKPSAKPAKGKPKAKGPRK